MRLRGREEVPGTSQAESAEQRKEHRKKRDGDSVFSQPLSRRQFVELLAGAGVSTLASSWLVDRVLALEQEGELPVRPGPGIESRAPTVCGLCQGGCGLEVRRIDGLPVGIRGLAGHPVNRGRLCALPHAAIQLLFSPDRVRKPLRRAGRRGQGLWAEIGWNEAEGIIEQRLRTLISAGSRGRVAFLDGRRPGLGRMVVAGFMRGIGSPHHVAAEEPRADDVAGRMFGWERAPGADLEQSRVVVLFRFDHLETDGSPVWQSGVHVLGRSRTFEQPIYLSVGPRLFGSAAKCDHWLPARPGTEGIVAMAMAHVILENRWEDREFLRSHSDWPDLVAAADHGFHDLLTALTPEVASESTGVPAERIENAARLFVEHQPGVALVGPGTLAAPTARFTIMAVNLLNLLVGAVGRAGTFVELPVPPLSDPWEPTDGTGAPEKGEEGIRTQTDLLRALLEHEPNPIDLLFVRESNPVFDSPTARAFRRGLATYDRTVVAFATELNETAMLADLVLPEPTFLERWDILTGTPIVPVAHASLQQPVIGPLFSSRQSEETLARVNGSLGELSRVKFKATAAEQLARRAARGLFADPRGDATLRVEPAAPPRAFAASWKELQTRIVWSIDDAHSRPAPPAHRITTSPGRVLGLAEEPSVHALRDLARPRLLGVADRYPNQLVAFRILHLRDGETTNLPMMMEQAGHWSGTMWVTWAELHPRTAAQSGVKDGDSIRIVSELGHIEATARVSEATPPGTVAVPIGFGHTVGSTAAGVGANVNFICDSGLGDPGWALRERVTRVGVVRI